MSGTGAEGESPREQGAALLRLGRFPEAVEALRRAVEQSPIDEGAWRFLGAALSQAGDPAGAVAAFEKTVALAPDSARNHYNLAVALQAVGRTGEAKAHFGQALELDPNHAQARAALDGPAAAPLAAEIPADAGPRGDDDLVSVGGAAPPPPPAPPRAAPPPAETAVPRLAPGVAGTSYAPPPVLGQNYPAPPPAVNGTLILILGILSLLVCGPLGIVAWIMGNNALVTIDRHGGYHPERGLVQAGRICGIIASLFIIGIFLFYIVFTIGIFQGIRR